MWNEEKGSANILAFPQPVASDAEFLEDILNNMSIGILVMANNHQPLFANSRYLEMYGLKNEHFKSNITINDLMRTSALRFDDKFIQSYIGRLKDRSGGDHQLLDVPEGRHHLVSVRNLPQVGMLVTHEDVTERRRSESQIAHMAHHDALTDLPNRTLLRARLTHELKRVKRGECIAVIALDLDHFKTVNDTLGHPIGDELLRLVADRLRSCTREPDTVARLGGDEFAIVMTQLNNAMDAAVLARRIRDSVSKPFHVSGHQIVTDTSIGISVSPDDGVDPDLLLKNADMALYGAKSDGRGTWRFFEQEMDTRMRARRELEMSLREAIANNEFRLYYQPLVSITGKKIQAFEALIRWSRSDGRIVSPADFIPVAEDTGLIVPIGEWVLRTACREAVNWPDHVKVAVNISPAQLFNRNIVDAVSNALACANLPAERLQLEITETVLLKNTFATLQTLHKLKGLGVQIALDDFGTGYSSLSYLRSFPFDKIKIDQSFIQDLGTGAEPYAIVSAVAGLAKGLKIASTAEGVETEGQLEILQTMGCTEIQGYLFSRPIPADGISKLFNSELIASTGAA